MRGLILLLIGLILGLLVLLLIGLLLILRSLILRLLVLRSLILRLLILGLLVLRLLRLRCGLLDLRAGADAVLGQRTAALRAESCHDEFLPVSGGFTAIWLS